MEIAGKMSSQTIKAYNVADQSVVGDVVTVQTGNIYVPQTPERFQYDLDGNVTQDGHWSYTWDSENRLIGVQAIAAAVAAGAPNLTLAFGYDPQGRRISKAVTNATAATSYQRQLVYDRWTDGKCPHPCGHSYMASCEERKAVLTRRKNERSRTVREYSE